MIGEDLRAAERAYLAQVRARFAAHAGLWGELTALRLPPPQPLQGIERIGAGPVPARIDAMRAAGVEPDAAVSVGAGAGVGVRTPLVAALACEPRLWLQGAGAEGESLCAALAYGCARAGWAYTTLRWPFQPVPILPGVEAPGGQRHLEEQLAASAVDGWRRQGRLLLLLPVPGGGAGEQAGWWQPLERWMARRGHGCRVVLVAEPGALPYSLARWFAPFVLQPAGERVRAARSTASAADTPAPDMASPDPDARLAAVEAAVYVGSAAAATLLPALRDFWHEVRGSAAIGLGLVGGTEAIPALAMAMGDPAAAVRVAATAAIGQIAGQIGGQSNGLALDVLLAGLAAFYADVRAAAAQALGALGATPPMAATVVARLAGRLDDPSECVRQSAAAALGTMGEPATDLLVSTLAAPREGVRVLAAQALGCGGDVRAVAPLAGALRDPSPAVRTAAARALGLLRAGTAAAILAAAVEDPEPPVRAAVAEALGEVGGVACAGAAVRLLGDADAGVRTAASVALMRLGPEATPLLLAALGEPDPAQRWLAVHILGVRALGEGDGEAGSAVVPALAAALRDPYSAVRWLAAETLGQVGSLEGVRAALAHALDDRNPLVREAVRGALARLG